MMYLENGVERDKTILKSGVITNSLEWPSTLQAALQRNDRDKTTETTIEIK